MFSARFGHAIRTNIRIARPGRFVALWALELVILASSYGVLLLTYAAWSIHTGANQDLALRTIWSGVIVFTVVTIVAFMNFIASGFILTSLIARFICMAKAPKTYALIFPVLVVLHIELISHLDGAWPLTISRPLFLGWGAATACAVAYLSTRNSGPAEAIGSQSFQEKSSAETPR